MKIKSLLTTRSNIAQLIEACKKQDWAAQKKLYLLIADDMMSVAVRYAVDLPSAKDLVQETLLTFFRKIDDYDASKGSLGGWLRRILINIHLGEYRKNKRLFFTDEVTWLDQKVPDASIVELLEADDILKLLKKLPEGCRMIFNLKVIEGYSHIEIGQMLNISASASRSQLTRAKKLLRDLITQEFPLEGYNKTVKSLSKN